jgi:uncharacterized protein (UPF0332 family)
MSFDWPRFLELANTLAVKPTNGDVVDQERREAALRSAASRAYYAAFHHAKGYLHEKYPHLAIAAHGTSHEQVPEYLKDRERTKIEKGAARRLEDLKRLRKWADYQRTHRATLEADIEQALRDANSVLTTLV